MAKSVEELLAENNELLRQSLKQKPSTTSSGSSRGGAGGSDMSDSAFKAATGVFTDAVQKLPLPLREAGNAFLQVARDINAGMGAWQNLSKTGVSFGNSIIDMQAAAKGARMDLGEFNDIVVQNKASLAGFGGSLDKGAKEFAKASKMMFDQSAETTDGLRNLGYSNKDLNELLALQMGAIGTSMASGKERDELAIKATSAMAHEMDLMAKLTGKSREEQMDAQKKLAADQAYQAQLRIKTANMSDKEAAEYKLKMDQQYAEANARGQGQAFKETFLYGTVVTKEAIGQVVAGGKSALATLDQAKLAADGNFDAAKKKSEEAMEEGAKLRNNAAQNQMIVQSGLSESAGAFAKDAAARQVYADGIEKTRKEMEAKSGKPVSETEATREYLKTAKESQKATDESTKAVVNFDQRMKDASSAIMSGLIQPIVKEVGPSLKSLNENVLGASGAFKKFTNAGEAAGKGGFEAAKTGRTPTTAELMTFGTAKGIGLVNKAVAPTETPVGTREGGTLEKTGSPIEPMDALVKIHKDETVLDPDSTKKLAQQLSESSKSKFDIKGMTGGLGDAVKNMPKVDAGKMPGIDIKGMTGGLGDAVKNMPKVDTGKMPGIDLNKILTDIKTTVSKVEVSNWPKELTELKKLTPVQTQPAPAAKAAEPKKEEPKKEEPKKEEPKKEQPKVEPKKVESKKADDEAAIAREDLASLEAARAKNQKESKVEPNSPNSSQSYSFNGKEVSKEDFDKKIAANPQLAKLMEMTQANLAKATGGVGGAGGSDSGGDQMTEAEAAMERMKAFQAQIGKDLEAGAVNELENKKEVVQQTREAINEELMVKQKAIDDAQALTKKSEDLAKRREGIEDRLAANQARVAALREIAGERDLTNEEQRQLKTFQNGVIRAENNLKRNLEDQAKLDEALAKVKKESNENELKSSEQQARDKMELDAINNDEELEAAQADLAAQAKFTHVDKDKIGEDIDEIVPTSIGTSDSQMKAVEAQDNIDKAIERQKEAQQKLNDLLMGASEEDIGEQYEIYAKNLSDANENLAKVVDESMGNLIGTVEDSSTNFSDSLTQVSEDINEFSGVDEAIGGQMLENMDLGPKYSEQVSEDINEFSGVDEAIGGQMLENMDLEPKYSEQVSEDINEFSGVDEAIGGQMLENMDLGPKYSEQVSEDIDSSVPSTGATDSQMKAAEAQDNIDKAIERQKEAQQKLNDLLMGASEEDIGEQYEILAQELSDANENLAKVVDESMGDLIGTVEDSGTNFSDSLTQVSEDINEFSGVDEAIGGQMLENMDLGPKYGEQDSAARTTEDIKNEKGDDFDRSKISFGSVTKIGANGMPILAAPKKDDKNLPKVENPDDARENAKFKRQADESKKSAEDKKKVEEDKKGKPGDKTETKSLDDVVKTLEKLNTAMEKLVSVNNTNTTLLRDQIKATKGVASAAGGNLIGAQ